LHPEYPICYYCLIVSALWSWTYSQKLPRMQKGIQQEQKAVLPATKWLLRSQLHSFYCTTTNYGYLLIQSDTITIDFVAGLFATGKPCSPIEKGQFIIIIAL